IWSWTRCAWRATYSGSAAICCAASTTNPGWPSSTWSRTAPRGCWRQPRPRSEERAAQATAAPPPPLPGASRHETARGQGQRRAGHRIASNAFVVTRPGMCGLAGIVSSRAYRRADLESGARRMIVPIAHRGPDDEGIWVDERDGIALGFRRLAILDLSAAGRQPMHSASGRYTLVFNGEVYNHLDLRCELERAGARFRGHSDTETILAAFEQWGIEPAVGRFIGMFAMAVWDAEARELSLLRDRLGIKPLYYSWRRGLLTFGSELRSLVEGPEFDREIDPQALADYLRYLYVPAPATIYRNAFKLPPGHILTVGSVDEAPPAPRPYWSLADAVAR